VWKKGGVLTQFRFGRIASALQGCLRGAVCRCWLGLLSFVRVASQIRPQAMATSARPSVKVIPSRPRRFTVTSVGRTLVVFV
jgi:hypothetical protein